MGHTSTLTVLSAMVCPHVPCTRVLEVLFNIFTCGYTGIVIVSFTILAGMYNQFDPS